MQSVNSNVLLRCAGPLEFVVDVGVLAENVAVADTQNLIAGVAVLVFSFVEVESEATLSIILLPLLGGKGHVESTSENTTDMGSRIVVAHNTHKGWTCQLRRDGLAPFYYGTLDPILHEKRKDILGYVVGSVGRGRVGIDPDPNHDRTKSLCVVLSVGNKASRVDGRIANLPIFHQVADLGTDSVPDLVKQGVVDFLNRLGREMGVSALGLGEGICEESRTVEEVRVVAVVSNAVVVSDPLVLRDSVSGDNGGIAALRGDGGCGEVRLVAQGRGGGGDG